MSRRAGLCFAFVACLFASACGGATPREVAVGASLVLPGAAVGTTTTVAAAAAPLVGESPTRVPFQRVGTTTARTRTRVRGARREPPRFGRIVIPAIGLDHPTYEGIEPAQIDFGPSHWPGTAMPGDPGNAVFPGHRTTFTHPFLDIDRLQAGDQVIFETERGRYTYEVRNSFVVDDEDLWIAEPTAGATFTLFSCHPKGSERQRFVVKGVLVASEKFDAAPTSTTTTAPQTRPGTLPRIGK